jgi:hypothetical protein
MNSKNKGSISEVSILLYFLKMGYTVSIPWGENAKYDLIVDDGQGLKRVQVKTGRLRRGSVLFQLCSVYYDSKSSKCTVHKYKDGDTDIFAIFCPDNGKIYIVPVSKLKSRC